MFKVFYESQSDTFCTVLYLFSLPLIMIEKGQYVVVDCGSYIFVVV